MDWRPYSRTLQGLLAVLLSTVAPLTRAIAQTVGSVGAVNPATLGTPPSASARTLTIGANVVQRERIQTNADGTVQLSFPDRTTLNIGRNSDLVIDEYVYNPAAGTGRMAASLAKGVLRFVGGQVSHTGQAQISTPNSTLGIRGGVGTVVYSADGAAFQGSGLPSSACGGALIVNHFGVVTVRNQVSQQVIRRPGFAVCVVSATQPIPEPFPIADATLQQIMARLTSAPGQRGGAAIPPTDQMVARLGAELPRLPDLNRAPGVSPIERLGIIGAGDAIVRDRSQTRRLDRAGQRLHASPVVSPPASPPPPPPPVISPPVTAPPPVLPPPPPLPVVPPPPPPPPPPLPLPPPPPPPPPPVVSPPVISPPVVSPPVTSPPVISPPVTSPPVTSPPVISPPVTSPPVTTPPVISPPIGFPFLPPVIDFPLFPPPPPPLR